MRFRDRFYTRPVARALTSPLGIVLAGAGTAVGLAVGLPIVAAVGLGAAAYAARVAAAIPKGFDAGRIDPYSLDDPWRGYVWQAKRSQRLYADAVRQAKAGPLRDRLEQIAERVATGLEECWRVAQSGQELSRARARLDVGGITKQLSQLTAGLTGAPDPASPLGQTMEALDSQLATAKRLDVVIADTNDRLRLLDARLDEAVARAIELSVRASKTDDLGGLGDDVDSVVSDMEALRVALDETDGSLTGSPPPTGLPSPTAAAPPSVATAPPPPASLPGSSGGQVPTTPAPGEQASAAPPTPPATGPSASSPPDAAGTPGVA